MNHLVRIHLGLQSRNPRGDFLKTSLISLFFSALKSASAKFFLLNEKLDFYQYACLFYTHSCQLFSAGDLPRLISKKSKSLNLGRRDL